MIQELEKRAFEFLNHFALQLEKNYIKIIIPILNLKKDLSPVLKFFCKHVLCLGNHLKAFLTVFFFHSLNNACIFHLEWLIDKWGKFYKLRHGFVYCLSN